MNPDQMTDTLGEYEYEDEFELEGDPFLGGLLGKVAGSILPGLLGEEERDTYGEYEGEFEDEFEALVSGDREVLTPESAAALMEVLATQAAEAESEFEADQFFPVLAALAPLAAKAVPMLAKSVAPHLVRGVASLGKRLWRSRARKRLVPALGTIARGAARNVLQQVAAGRPVTGQAVTRALAGSAARVLREPRRRVRCVQRSRQIATAAARRLATAAR